MGRETFCIAENCDMKRTGLTQRSFGQAPASILEQPWVPPKHFLIANPELEFHVNPIRINELKFPNRKYFAIFRVAFQTCTLPLLASTPSPSSIQRLAPSFQNLIEIPRLESRATPTKQRPTAKSNRDKNVVLWSAFSRHSRIRSVSAPLCDLEPLWPSSSATSGATLTLRAPQSNLPASCFVRALAGEHS